MLRMIICSLLISIALVSVGFCVDEEPQLTPERVLTIPDILPDHVVYSPCDRYLAIAGLPSVASMNSVNVVVEVLLYFNAYSWRTLCYPLPLC